MIKKLIILSLTFLLISCGEEEAPTKESPTKEETTKEETTEETTTVANTQTATTKPDTSQTESTVIDEDITEALFGNPDVFEETDLPEEPAPEETQPQFEKEVVAEVPEEKIAEAPEETKPQFEEGTYVLNRSFDTITLTAGDRKMFLQKNQCAHIPSLYPYFDLSRGRTTILYESIFPGYKLVSVHSTTITQEELKGVESHEECSEHNVRRIDSQKEIANQQKGYDVEERKALLTGNSFLVCNEQNDSAHDNIFVEADLFLNMTLSYFFHKKGEKPFQSVSEGNCLRVHNRHLGTISIRSGSPFNIVTPDWLTGTICKKSDCPTGDIFIEYIENDDGEKEPVARSLQDDDNVSRDYYKSIL